jgi:PAS domain S-box-containing protein
MKVQAEESKRVSVGDYARRMCIVLSLAVITFTAPRCDAEPPQPKKVLIIYSFADRSLSWSVEVLKSELRSRVSSPVNFYVEYLESARFQDADYEKSVAETLARAYATEKLDLLIVEAYPALSFVIRHREEMFPGTPIVFMAVHDARLAGQKIWPGVTGVTVTMNPGATLDLALRLHPDTTTVAVITNTSEFDRYWLSAVAAQIERRKDRVREIDLVGMSTLELLQRVETLPPHTLVLFQAPPLASIQPDVGVYDVMAKIGKTVPTYCIYPILCLGHGGIGGVQLDINEQKRLAAALGARILSGEKPEDIPVVHATNSQVQVDSRQLLQWKISEAALPPGSAILYKQLTFWEREKKYVIVVIVVLIGQAMLILGLLWQRARKRKAEAYLRESEKRFRVMADTTPSLIWMCDEAGTSTYLNDRWVAFTGMDPKDHNDSWMEFVHADDLKNMLDKKLDALRKNQPFSCEYRLRRRDGAFRWMFDVASPRVTGDGSFAGFIGSAIDVTDQKLAQEALEKVSGRLIEAQEKERLRISRELHDDVCQRLVLLSMKLEQAQGGAKESSLPGRLEGLQQYCSEIASDVQSLSHQLHSSKLEILGLVAAIKGFCTEFANQHEVTIAFNDKDVPRHLSKEVSLSFFRVAQEALHNAVKYSGVDEFAVELKGTACEVELVVRDAGAGFDVEEAKQNRGLGLISMQERLHLLHGTIDIESKIGKGTTVTARAPIVGIAHRTSGPLPGDQNADAAGVA